MRTHAGVPQRKKKSCELCPKQFYTNQQLIIHMRMHSGERPVECDLCPKTFLSTLAMKKHRRVHTGEKPFACKFVSISVHYSIYYFIKNYSFNIFQFQALIKDFKQVCKLMYTFLTISQIMLNIYFFEEHPFYKNNFVFSAIKSLLLVKL